MLSQLFYRLNKLWLYLDEAVRLNIDKQRWRHSCSHQALSQTFDVATVQSMHWHHKRASISIQGANKFTETDITAHSSGDGRMDITSTTENAEHAHKHTASFLSVSVMVAIYITVRQSGERVRGNESLYIKASPADSDRSSWLHENVKRNTSLSAGLHNICFCVCVCVCVSVCAWVVYLTVHPYTASSRMPRYLLENFDKWGEFVCACGFFPWFWGK